MTIRTRIASALYSLSNAIGRLALAIEYPNGADYRFTSPDAPRDQWALNIDDFEPDRGEEAWTSPDWNR